MAENVSIEELELMAETLGGVRSKNLQRYGQPARLNERAIFLMLLKAAITLASVVVSLQRRLDKLDCPDGR